MEIWHTSINELIHIFRDGLITLIPFLEKSTINWQNEEANYDWDIVTTALFKAIVISPIEYAKELDYSNCKELRKFGIKDKDYSDQSFIKVQNIETNELNALLDFKTKDSYFDYLIIDKLDKKTLTMKESLTIPFSECKFVLALNNKGSIKIIDEIDVLQ